MGVIKYEQAQGMGYIQAIAALVGAVAGAGANVFQTIELGKATKKSQKLQKNALQLEIELRRRQQDLMDKRARDDSITRQAGSILGNRTAQTAIAAVVVLGVTWVMFGRRKK